MDSVWLYTVSVSYNSDCLHHFFISKFWLGFRIPQNYRYGCGQRIDRVIFTPFFDWAEPWVDPFVIRQYSMPSDNIGVVVRIRLHKLSVLISEYFSREFTCLDHLTSDQPS